MTDEAPLKAMPRSTPHEEVIHAEQPVIKFPNGVVSGNWMSKPSDRTQSYILADHTRALVAAEREACAGVAEAEMKKNAAETYSSGTVSVHRSGQSAAKCYAAGAILEAIRARTDEDAEAALADLLKAERDKALREAAAVLDRHDGVPCIPAYPEKWTSDELTRYEAGQMDAATSWQSAILALIEEKEPSQ